MTSRGGTLGGSVSTTTYTFPLAAAGKMFILSARWFGTGTLVLANTGGVTIANGTNPKMLNNTATYFAQHASASGYTPFGAAAQQSALEVTLCVSPNSSSLPMTVTMGASIVLWTASKDNTLLVLEVDPAFVN